MKRIPSSPQWLANIDDHSAARLLVADNGPGKEDIGAAGFATGVVEELPGHGVVDAQLAVRNAAARHEAMRLDLLVARAKEFIDKRATEGITPRDVAIHLGISRPLLDLRFRETQKTSVGRLITETKLSEVARKLRETRLSIAAIQETCGFKNANALKNLFKRRYKMSMRDWRKKNSQ